MATRLHELLDKRTPNTKHFLNDDGTYTAEISLGDVHYEDSKGHLHDIDTSLFDEADFDATLEVVSKEASLLSEEFPITKARVVDQKSKGALSRDDYDFQALKIPFKARLPRFFSRGYYVGKGTNTLRFIPVGAYNSRASITNNTAYYTDAWDDTDVELKITPTGIKETIIVKTDLSPNSFSFEVIGSINDDLTAGSLRLLPAWLKDAEGTERDVSLTVRREGTKTFIDMSADLTGLVYPIEIDPTTTIQPDPTAGKDSYTIYGDAALEEKNYGGGTVLVAGRPSTTVYRSWAQFDLSTVKGVVTAASLDLYFYYENTTTARYYDIHRVTSSWDESTITHNTAPSFDTTVSSSISIGGVNTWHSWDVKGLVEGWQKGQYANYGLLLKTKDETVSSQRNCYSSDYTDNTSLRPKLIVTYDDPPSAPVVTAPNGGEVWDATHTITWDPAVDVTDGTLSIAPNAGGSMGIGTGVGGQKFSMPKTGYIKEIGIVAWGDSAHSRTLSLVSLDSNYNVTATHASATVNLSTSANMVSFVLSTPLKFSSGASLGIHLSSGSYGASLRYESNSYSGGAAYYGTTASSGDAKSYVNYEERNTNLQSHIQLSTNGGGAWHDVVSLTTAGATSYSYDFSPEPETTNALIRIRAWDGVQFGPFDQSDAAFEIKHNTAPSAPTGLTPGGTSSSPEVIKDLTPLLDWVFNDADSGDSQSAFQVLVYNSAGTLIHDSNKILSSNTYYTLPSGVLSGGLKYYWRVRTWDVDGDVSAYSADAWILTVKVIGTMNVTVGTGTVLSIPVYDPTVGMDGKNQLRIQTPNGVGCFELVDVTDSIASPYRIHTHIGLKAIAK